MLKFVQGLFLPLLWMFSLTFRKSKQWEVNTSVKQRQVGSHAMLFAVNSSIFKYNMYIQRTDKLCIFRKVGNSAIYLENKQL